MTVGRMHSFQSLGTVDGPGVRAVVFLQGCPLHCACCHNPDTWAPDAGQEITPDALLSKILRCKNYFGAQGGVTVSGGEPLLQAGFVAELFELLHSAGIHTALDTSGCLLNEEIRHLLTRTDLVILDYKYTNDADYLQYTRCHRAQVELFLQQLDKTHCPTWLRQVIIPGLNDSEASVLRLAEVRAAHPCVQKIELLPFRKLCLEKYRAMQLPFPLEQTPEASAERVQALQALLDTAR